MRLLTFLVVLLVAGCGQSVEVSMEEKETSATDEDLPVIGYLVTRDWEITMKIGAHGSLYTVVSRDGRMAAEDVNEAYLQTHLPDIYQFIESSVAGDAIPWAGPDGYDFTEPSFGDTIPWADL